MSARKNQIIHAVFGKGSSELSPSELLSIVLHSLGFVAFVVWAFCPIPYGFMTLLYAYLKSRGVS